MFQQWRIIIFNFWKHRFVSSSLGEIKIQLFSSFHFTLNVFYEKLSKPHCSWCFEVQGFNNFYKDYPVFSTRSVFCSQMKLFKYWKKNSRANSMQAILCRFDDETFFIYTLRSFIKMKELIFIQLHSKLGANFAFF